MDNPRILAKDRLVSNDSQQTRLNNNDMVIGCSGAGKTTSYVSVNIAQHYGSMVIADTKGNLCRQHRAELEAAGYRVQCLDFVDTLRSCAYNPLHYIRRNEGELGYNEQDVVTLAEVLVPLMDKREPFWEISARTVLKSLLAFTLEALPPEEQHLGSVLELFTALDTPVGANIFQEWEQKCPKSYAAAMYRMYQGILSVERTWNCIRQFLASALEIFSFEGARNIFFSDSPFRFENLAREKTALFVNISDSDRSLDRLVNLFYTQLFHSLIAEADSQPDGRLRVPVRIYLDDFATNATIPHFSNIISTIRSRDISVSLLLQNLTQLESMYPGADADTIISNCDHMLVIGGSLDKKTAEYVGTRARKTPEYIMSMPLDSVFLFERGKAAELVEKTTPYYQISQDEQPDFDGFDYTIDDDLFYMDEECEDEYDEELPAFDD